MKIGLDGLKIIKHYEGLKLKAYTCPAGKLTIGYGHVILPHEKLTMITEEKAHELLTSDVQGAEKCIHTKVTTHLDQWKFDALVSFIFNVGTGAFSNSTLLKLLNLNQHAEAAQQFDQWTKSAGKVLPGLVKRRASERILFSTGKLEL